MPGLAILHKVPFRFSAERAFVFLSGFSMMAFELLAARLVAPYLGNSIVTWTAVIASILLGIVLGAPLGGLLADRYVPRRLLAILLIVDGLISAAAIFAAAWIGPSFASATISLTLLACAFGLLIFFPLALVSAAIQPTAIRSELKDVAHTGRVFGSLGAWNALGSILGTYFTGFIFQAYLSTHAVWLSLSALLIIAGLVQLLRLKRL